MNTIKLLMDEHRIIEKALDCLDICIEECRINGKLDKHESTQLIRFFREFADRCHHKKEEHQLFPMLVAKGYGNGCGPVDVMLRSHIQKEDHCLFPAADKALSSDEHKQLAAAFHQANNDGIETDVHRQYAAIADRFARRHGVLPAGPGSCCEH